MISIKIRFSNGQISDVTDVSSSSRISEIKSLLRSRNLTPVEPESQRLIFKGRILPNEQTLEEAGVTQGSTIHFVKSSASSQPPPPAPANVAASATTTPPPTNNPFANLFQPQQPPQDQSRLMMNMLRNMPQMQTMMERNPQLAEMLNSPEAMQQLMQMANPATRDEVLRNHDRQLANLETLPGGQAALLRLFNEVGDMDTMFDTTPNAPTVTRPNNAPAATAPEAAPMPNPWSNNNRTPAANPWAPPPPPNAPLRGGVAPPPLPNAEVMQSLMNQPEMRQRMEELMRNPEALQQQMQQMQQLLGDEGMAQMHQRAMQMMSQPGALEAMQSQFGANGGGGGGGGFPAFPPMTMPPSPANPNPEQRFADQLVQLEQMGFSDRAKNLRALVATNGNVHAAVERILMS